MYNTAMEYYFIPLRRLVSPGKSEGRIIPLGMKGLSYRKQEKY